MTTPTDNSGKITCKKCGREDVPDWNGKGHCITCARDEVLGTPNTPIEDSKVKDLKVFQAATNALTRAGIDKETLGRFQANWERQLLAWRDKAVAEAETGLQPFEIQNYKRLLALESRGVEEYRKLRASPTLSAESVVAFINQLSPWNLATTGIEVLKAYVQKEIRLTIPTKERKD